MTKRQKRGILMNTIELNAEIYRQLGYLADDRSYLEKAEINLFRKLRATDASASVARSLQKSFPPPKAS